MSDVNLKLQKVQCDQEEQNYIKYVRKKKKTLFFICNMLVKKIGD